jgi:hypothetical protein
MLNDNDSHCQSIQEKAASSTSSSLSRPSSFPDKFIDPQAWLQSLQNRLELSDADIEVERQNLLRSHPDLASKCENPHYVIRGLHSQNKPSDITASLEVMLYDYLTATLSADKLTDVSDIVQNYWPGLVLTLGRGLLGYTQSLRSEKGITIVWTSTGSTEGHNQGLMTIEISGAPIRELLQENKLRLLSDLYTLGARRLRICGVFAAMKQTASCL